MNKLPILVDMDGVFADFMTSYYKIAKEKYPQLYKILPKINEQKLFYIDEEIEEEYPHLKRAAESIVDDLDVFKNIIPYDGMIDGMKTLREEALKVGRHIFICTAPHKSNKFSYTQKAEWIEKYLGHDWLDNLLIVRDKTVCSGAILIDDKPEPLGKLIPNWKHVVFDRSYNRTLKDKFRIYDLSNSTIKSIIKYCDELN